jgi:hypothetical protein
MDHWHSMLAHKAHTNLAEVAAEIGSFKSINVFTVFKKLEFALCAAVLFTSRRPSPRGRPRWKCQSPSLSAPNISRFRTTPESITSEHSTTLLSLDVVEKGLQFI